MFSLLQCSIAYVIYKYYYWGKQKDLHVMPDLIDKNIHKEHAKKIKSENESPASTTYKEHTSPSNGEKTDQSYTDTQEDRSNMIYTGMTSKSKQLVATPIYPAGLHPLKGEAMKRKLMILDKSGAGCISYVPIDLEKVSVEWNKIKVRLNHMMATYNYN